jgi:TolA-binding protein
MIYPVASDSGETGNAYGVSGVPQAYLISHEGIVIWEGHPKSGELAQKVRDAVSAIPADPFTEMEKDKDFSKRLKSALKDAAKRKFSAAVASCKKVLDDEKASEKEKSDAKKVIDKIEELAKSELDTADSYSAKKWFYDALETLKKIEKDFAGLDAAKTASEKIKEIEKNDEAKEEIKAGRAFEKAKNLLSRGDAVAARKALEEIVNKFPKSATAERAQELLKQLK